MQMRHILEAITKRATFQMWHGSRRWDGMPEIRAPRAGRYEAGPGIYLTTSYLTARRYAKSGGMVLLVEVDRDLHLADEVEIPLTDALQFAKTYLRKKHRADIAADLRYNAERMQRDSVAAAVLVNLTVNYEAGAGRAGIALARFLRDHGVDAGLEHPKRTEDWLVVINPKIIRKVTPMPAREVTADLRDLPPVTR